MAVCYNKLWKLLIDRKMKKKDLIAATGISRGMVTLRFDEKHSWFKCPRCSGIFPFTVWGKCAHCGKGEPKLMTDKDFAGINFWRDPVIRAVHGDPQALMTRINTEEHTAQLSHKDHKQLN